MKNENNLRIWDAVRTPPENALKEIRGGRLAGMTDINPQWRYEAMTEFFGPVGLGWSYKIKRLWTEAGGDGQVCAFAEIELFYKEEGTTEWSDAVPGIGGSMLVAQERSGLHVSDEAYKMAVTDALSVAMKALGVAADIYRGRHDSKYAAPKDDHAAVAGGGGTIPASRQPSCNPCDPNDDGYCVKCGRDCAAESEAPVGAPLPGAAVCQRHGVALVRKTGKSAKGPWAGWFCPNSPKTGAKCPVAWE